MSSKKLVVNELLAFLDKQLDCMDEVSVTQICTSNWKEEEIRSTKVLLYESLGMSDRMPSRRRDEKGEKSLQDMIRLFKVTDPDEWPVTFVCKDLHRLPPVTFDHVDVTRLLKDINTLKTNLADLQLKFEASQSTISDLRAEIVELKNNKSVSRSSDASNPCSGALDASPSSFASAKLDSTSVIAVQRHTSPRPAPRASPVVTKASTPSHRAYATAASLPPGNQRSSQLKEPTPAKEVVPELVPEGPVDNEGFKEVVRKRKKPLNRNKCGTALSGPNMLLRAAVPTTLLYVSRLHYSTKSEDLVEYMRVKSKFTLRVMKLESRQNVNFNSYVVRVPTTQLETFTREDFWPKGVVFRRYRGRLPDTPSSCGASQTIRTK